MRNTPRVEVEDNERNEIDFTLYCRSEIDLLMRVLARSRTTMRDRGLDSLSAVNLKSIRE